IVDHGMIMGAGKKNSVLVPPDAEIVDLRGKFIMPGLIDTYVQPRSYRDVQEMLAWGVTSVNCVFASIAEAKMYDAKSLSDTNFFPRIFTTAPIFTPEHGVFGEKTVDDNGINRFPKT